MICFIGELMIKAKLYGFSYDEYVEQAHLINNFVFPYPLSEDELNTAIRQEEWDSLDFGEEKQLLFDMAEDVINTLNCVWVNEQIAFYNHNTERYSTNEIIIRAYLQEKYSKRNITTARMKEVIEQVKIQLQNNQNYWRERNKEYILCNNELVSMNKDDVIPNTRTIFTDIYYPYSIMSKEEFDSFNGRAKSFMEEISCGNEKILQIMWECIGCMLAPDKPFGKIFIWYGSGANGKSLLIKLMDEIMGEFMTHANVLTINDKFSLENVFKGICNVTDDVGITALKETGLLKSIVQGGRIEVHRKFKDSIWWKPNSQFVLCCNDVPRINDTTPGMIRRLSFIPFEMNLPPEKLDIKLERTILEDPNNLRYLMTGGIFAFREAFKKKELTQCEKQKDLIESFLEENRTSIDLFFDNLLQTEYEGNIEKLCRFINGKTTEEVYSIYKQYRYPEEDIETQRAFSVRFRRKLPSYMTTKKVTIGGSSFTSYCFSKGK